MVVVQTKANRLGMYLLGQALFSKKLIKKHNPKSIRTVAICGKGDEVLRKEAEIEGIEVIVIN